MGVKKIFLVLFSSVFIFQITSVDLHAREVDGLNYYNPGIRSLFSSQTQQFLFNGFGVGAQEYLYFWMERSSWLKRTGKKDEFESLLTKDENPSYDFSAYPAFVPNDPFYGSSGLFYGYDDMWGLKRINGIEQAWNYTTGEDVLVAVLDTGVDYLHPDIDDNIFINVNDPVDGIDNDGNGFVDDYMGWDFVGSDVNNISPDNDPMDLDGHGTHVSGIIGAEGDNETGIVGVAYDSRILPVKVLDDSGSGLFSTIENGIRYAADMGAKVINLSLGAFTRVTKSFKDAVKYAVNKGAILVAAAGNSARNVKNFVPASLDNVIAVSAVGPDDNPAYFTNFGSEIEVSAPGMDILSLYTGYWNRSNNDPSVPYAIFDGTSMAAPFVTGFISLLLSYNPDLTLNDVRNILQLSSEDLGEAGFDKYFGYGLIDAENALVVIDSGSYQDNSVGDNGGGKGNGKGGGKNPKGSIFEEIESKNSIIQSKNEQFTGLSPNAEFIEVNSIQ